MPVLIVFTTLLLHNCHRSIHSFVLFSSDYILLYRKLHLSCCYELTAWHLYSINNWINRIHFTLCCFRMWNYSFCHKTKNVECMSWFNLYFFLIVGYPCVLIYTIINNAKDFYVCTCLAHFIICEGKFFRIMIYVSFYKELNCYSIMLWELSTQ